MAQKPKLGDLIEINQLGYQHWAVYVGGGYGVHLASDDQAVPNASFSLPVSTKKALVKKQWLSEVIEGDKWRVNYKYNVKHDPKPRQEIAQAALQKVGQEIDYRMNCEHFANYQRYGQYECSQVVKEAGILQIGTEVSGLGTSVAPCRVHCRSRVVRLPEHVPQSPGPPVPGNDAAGVTSTPDHHIYLTSHLQQQV